MHATSVQMPADATSQCRILVRTQQVTPSDAGAWRVQYHYEGQRRLRSGHVTELAAAMEASRFQQGTAVAFAVLPSGRRFLVNGQHTLAAIARSGLTQELTVIEHMAADMDEVRRIYARSDQGLKRGFTDLPRPEELTQQNHGAVGAAIRFIAGGLTRRVKMEPEVIRDLEDHYLPSAVAFFGYLEGVEENLYWRFKRAVIVAIGIVTVADAAGVIGEERVRDFWRGAAMDDGLQRGDPRKHLIEHLKSTTLSNVGRAGVTVSPEYQARYIAACWNKWTANQTDVRLVKVIESAPIRLNHTRFAR